MTAVLQHPESQATAKTTSARQDDFAGTTAKARSRLAAAGEVRALTPLPIKTIRLKGPGGIDCPARPASTPAVHVKAQQAQARSSSRTGRRAQANQGPTGQPSPRQSPHPGPATSSGLCGPGSEAICTSSPVQRSTAIGYDEQGLGQGLHQQGDPPTQIPPARFGLGLGEGQAQPSPYGNTSSTQQSPTVSPATLAFAGRPAGFGHAHAHALGHAHTHTRSQSYGGSTDFSSLLFAQTHPQQLYQYQEQFRDQLQNQYQAGNPNAQFDLDFQPQRHFGRPTEAPAPATGHQHHSSSPPPPHPPPHQPHRRRPQPTTSRRQTLSHCRSRRLAPRQRLDPPASHRRQSPFLPPPPHPPPPSSLAAASDLSSSLPPSPSPSPAPTSSSSGVFSASSSSHRHTLSSPSPLSVSSLPHPHSPPTTAMSRSSRNPPPTSASATRQNEYFVPRDGIDREVISADICRYLGNDALVRPGHYENPQTGQVVQGYYITAYRNLTTAMIEDLKADSARWDSERRAQTSRNTPGGIHASRDASGVPARHSSNSPLVQYRYSETHQSRQHHGPTESPYQADPYRDAGYDGGPRYPGTGAPGYTGAAGSSYSQQGYASTSSGAYGGYPPPQQSPPPTDPRFASTTPQGGSTLNQAFQPPQDPYMAMGTNRNQRGYAGDAFANTASSAATTGASQPGYPAVATSPYPYSSQVPPSGAQSYGAMQQPQDPFYGRGAYSSGFPPTLQTASDSLASPAGQSTQQAFAAQGQQQQYDETPRTRTSATPTNTQTNPSGSSSRRSDRESDRHSSDRHHRSSRR